MSEVLSEVCSESMIDSAKIVEFFNEEQNTLLNIEPALVAPEAILVNESKTEAEPVILSDDSIIETPKDPNKFRYWEYNAYGGKLDVSTYTVINGLTEEGCAKIYPTKDDLSSTFVKTEKKEVIEMSPELMQDMVNSYAYAQPKNYDITVMIKNKGEDFYHPDSESVEIKDVLKAIANTSGTLFSKTSLANLRPVTLPLIKDTKDKCSIFYQNKLVEITKDGIESKPYDESDGHIWRKWKLKRDIDLSVTSEGSEFETFIFNVCNNDGNRIKALKTAIGYLIHRYRDPSNNKAIILCDESLTGKADGRTGKSLLSEALSYIRSVSTIDGKRFDPTKQFAFQEVKIESTIVAMDDVQPDIDFEFFYHAITNGLTVEGKNKPAFKFPQELNPKMIFTTNYSIKGSGGSAEDRRAIYEFYPHYSISHKPVHEFGHLFFSEWDKAEWQKFDSFMFKCVQAYLHFGLIQPRLINYEEKKLIAATSIDFNDWAKEYFKEGYQSENSPMVMFKAVPKHLLAKDFIEFCHDESYNRDPQFTKKFNRWLKNYADHRGWEVIETNQKTGRSIRFEANKGEDTMDAMIASLRLR